MHHDGPLESVGETPGPKQPRKCSLQLRFYAIIDTKIDRGFISATTDKTWHVFSFQNTIFAPKVYAKLSQCITKAIDQTIGVAVGRI